MHNIGYIELIPRSSDDLTLPCEAGLTVVKRMSAASRRGPGRFCTPHAPNENNVRVS